MSLALRASGCTSVSDVIRAPVASVTASPSTHAHSCMIYNILQAMEMLAQLMSRALRTSNRFFLDSTTAIPLANHQSTSSQAHVLLPEQDASNVLQGMRAVFGKNQAAQHSQRQLDQQSDLLCVPSDAGLDFRHTHATQDPSKSSARQRGLFKRAPSIASRAMSSASQQTESHVTSAFGRLPSSVAIERKPSTTNGPLKPISFLTAGGCFCNVFRGPEMPS